MLLLIFIINDTFLINRKILKNLKMPLIIEVTIAKDLLKFKDNVRITSTIDKIIMKQSKNNHLSLK